jgi:hypothetical protein
MKTLIVLLFLSTSLAAQTFTGKYSGTYESYPVVMRLSSEDHTNYTGELNDSQNTYQVKAISQGNTITGSCTEMSMNIALDLTGILEGDKLSLKLSILGIELNMVLQKEGQTQPATSVVSGSAAPKDNKYRDPAVTGKWVRQENYNSGYGQSGSMSSETSMIFLADGRVAEGGSRTVVGGADFSGSSAAQGQGIIEGLIWWTENNQFYLQISKDGQTETQKLGRYYIENNNMLITTDDGTKVLFYRG